MLPRHILVATDLSELSLPALTYALELGEALSSHVTMIHVLSPTPTPPGLEAFALEGMPIDWEQRLTQARLSMANDRLQQLVEKYRRPGVHLDAKVLYGLVPEVLAEYIQKLGAHLLVVGSHGRSGLSHLFLGSVAERLMRSVPCPVLVVRPTVEPAAS